MEGSPVCIQAEHGMQIAEAIARRGIRKRYLPRNTWRRAVAQQGGIQTLATAGSKYHVPRTAVVKRDELYIHTSRGRRGREIDHHTEEFVDATRMGTAV